MKQTVDNVFAENNSVREELLSALREIGTEKAERRADD